MASRAVRKILSAVWAGSRGGVDLPDGLVRLCARTLPVSGVGLAVMTEEGPAGTVAASDGGALQLEELQFTLGEGPCVDASRTGRPVLVPDLAGTSRRTWSQFGAGADAAGLRAADRDHHGVAVHVQPSHAVHQLFHLDTSSPTTGTPSGGGLSVKESEVRARGSTTGCPRPPRHTFLRARGTKRQRRQAGRTRPSSTRPGRQVSVSAGRRFSCHRVAPPAP
jgi:hypothetical protein